MYEVGKGKKEQRENTPNNISCMLMKIINGNMVSDNTEVRMTNGMESVEKCISPALLGCGCLSLCNPNATRGNFLSWQ